MDKRTIVFVLLVSICFFGLNMFFGYQRDQEARALLQQRAKEQSLQQQAQGATLEKRRLSLDTLPIVAIYDEKQSSLASGIDVHNGTLTLAWAKPLPESIYVDGQEQKLVTSDYVLQGPVLYAAADFTLFDILALPPIDKFDVQLITFPVNNPPAVFLGEYLDKNISFPSEPPTSNGLALAKNEDGSYLPLGFYDTSSKLFVELQTLPLFTKLTKSCPLFDKAATMSSKTQEYYLLENSYQQLVFTNKGGAITEINLPFQSKENSASVVKEIGFDRDIQSGSPANARFPLQPAFTPNSSEAKEGALGGYYPLLRRGIEGSKKSKFALAPEYYAFNIISDYPDVAEMLYEVKEFTENKIVFQATSSVRKITKTYTLAPDAAPYCFDLTIKIEGVGKNLYLASGIPDVELMSNSSSPQIQYKILRKGKVEVEKIDLPKPKENINLSSFHPDWIVNSNGYLGVLMQPLTPVGSGLRALCIPGSCAPTRLSVIDPEYEPYPNSKYPGYEILVPFTNEAGTSSFRIFAGPFEEDVLKAIDKKFTDPETGENPGYITTRTFYGFFSFISEPFAKVLFVVMEFFYFLTHSWAFSIILLTIFLRILLYPLNAWSIKSMRRMQEISPEVQAIQKKYKKEPKKAQVEIMQLYKEKKVNPFMGCLPILIQLPFLIAMFDLLKSSFQLRGAGFIPGWIDNLTAPDVLFRWKQPIFFIGTEFHLLPIILGAVMFLQQKISSPAPKDPSQMTDQQRQQKAMGTMMAILFTVMFYNFPSGLNIYWLSSMLLGILQQWGTNKFLLKKDTNGTTIVVKKKN